MTETTKTSIFLTLAVVLVGLAFMTRPVVREVKMEEMVGKPLFQKFTDPLAVKKLEIVRMDAAGEVDDFRIAEIDGVWSIPSHDNYPADAKDQMGRVTEALVDLKVLDVVAKPGDVTDATSLHTLYGVIDPQSEQASIGEGIGVKVVLTGAGEEPLVDLIVGKEVAPKEKKNPEDPEESGKMRYVRVTGEVSVYVVEIDPSRFSTNFDQWIEKNLLDINTFDVKEIYVDEYSLQVELEMTQRGPREVIAPTFIGDMTFTYDASGTGAEKWSLKKWMGFRGQKYEYYERKLKPEQELNVETLDGMISALNDLKIVDVTKKPAALAGALRKGESLEAVEPDPSLKKSGFFLVPMPDLKGGTTQSRKQLLSNEGDIQLRMKDGIRYHFRFGDLTGTESEIEAETTSPVMGANRYLFITADFDPSAIPPADIKPLKELPVSKEPNEEFERQVKEVKEENERIEKSNQRETQRYAEAVEAGEKRAKKLTERFADWYYVIPEDVYKKIHLTQNNALRDKKAGESATHGEGSEEKPTETTPEAKTPELPTLPGMEGMLKNPELKDKPAPATPEKSEPAKNRKQKTGRKNSIHLAARIRRSRSKQED